MTESTRTNNSARRFQFILIKPSHYDAQGYVVQWMKSTMPSNSLAAVYGLAVDAAERGVLGPDLPIDVTAIDETNKRVRPDELIKLIHANGGEGLGGIVGVQSNEFPRAVDIARPFLAEGIQVMIGGFHVSGCLSMLPELPDDIKAARELGVSIFAGEAEEHIDTVIRDAAAHSLQPIYNHMTEELPCLADVPAPPFLPKSSAARRIRA